jgi:hypothetical protein
MQATSPWSQGNGNGLAVVEQRSVNKLLPVSTEQGPRKGSPGWVMQVLGQFMRASADLHPSCLPSPHLPQADWKRHVRARHSSKLAYKGTKHLVEEGKGFLPPEDLPPHVTRQRLCMGIACLGVKNKIKPEI